MKPDQKIIKLFQKTESFVLKERLIQKYPTIENDSEMLILSARLLYLWYKDFDNKTFIFALEYSLDRKEIIGYGFVDGIYYGIIVKKIAPLIKLNESYYFFLKDLFLEEVQRRYSPLPVTVNFLDTGFNDLRGHFVYINLVSNTVFATNKSKDILFKKGVWAEKS